MVNDSRKVIVVSGYFDPIHAGHISLIKYAKKLFSKVRLIVVIHSDEDTLKKSGYVIYKSYEIAELLLSLDDLVDDVVVSLDNDGSVTKTLDFLRPNYYVKGPDRNSENMPKDELEMCKKISCEIVYQPGMKIGNSSSIKKRVLSELRQ